MAEGAGLEGSCHQGRRGKPFSHLLKADEVPVAFSLKVDDAPPLLLSLVQPLALFLLAQALCIRLVQLLEGKEQSGTEGRINRRQTRNTCSSRLPQEMGSRFLILSLGLGSLEGFLHSSVGKESACNAGDPGLIPGSERSAGEGIGYPLQYSGLENSMDCIVHGVTKSWT